MRTVVRAAAFVVAVLYLRRGLRPVLAGFKVGLKLGTWKGDQRWRRYTAAELPRLVRIGAAAAAEAEIEAENRAGR